ncbi:tyrosine-type recombinase/integrase [Botrimarina sp.]|uniref:tyrosine-type recombinase/integrase n=1 Tax=Botrimarina sp. TaxID=2795802 RepID=UPI0032EAF3C6
MLGPFVDEFLRQRKRDPTCRPRTYASYEAPFKHLREHFGDSTSLRSITKARARDWRDTVAEKRKKNGEPFGENTVRKYVTKVRTLFNVAVADELIDRNPFAGLPAATVRVESRQHFVTDEDAKKVLKECPSVEWRLVFALCRYGGLRCPSEVLTLRWSDVLWDQSRFIVRSPKTGTRVTPLFPELRTVLEAAHTVAAPGVATPGDGYVVTLTRDSSANLRTTMTKIVTRAGLKPWPKLFQNLRATRATELADQFPGHVVSAWLGHSERIADRHYRQVTDQHFERASGEKSAAPGAEEYVCTAVQTVAPQLENAVFSALEELGVAREGLEPPTKGL